MQSQRYEWDAAGRLRAASVYLLEQQPEQLQSRVEFERDPLGRLTEEAQILYAAQPPAASPNRNPVVEYEYRIGHQLDQLGNRQQSQLQGVGDIDWLRYGSGHVHGLTHNGEELIGFERDSLHREVKRHLHGQDEAANIHISRWRDSLGRLQGIHLEQLPAQALNPAPQILIGQITERQYHYDALGQMVAVQTPEHSLRYGYDPAGRLRAMADSLNPHQGTRWEIDAAGNRLPGKITSGQQQQQDWAQQVHRSWRQHEFNLLGQGQAGPIAQGPITQWSDNRIGFNEDSAWRYDGCGNRVEQVSQSSNERYSRQRLSYDGGHQLTAIEIEGIDAQGNSATLSASASLH